ncbi:MAG: helix-turn-helix transcriptional regulator [Oscillospiraceae bacterium]|nr:helix-turn-helix transcriptional regulator [Oscillospiraceae bacterium]
MKWAGIIKEIRTVCLLSQEDFAKELGVSFTTVNRWETGKSKPSYKALKLIDDYCKKNAVDIDIKKKLAGE